MTIILITLSIILFILSIYTIYTKNNAIEEKQYIQLLYGNKEQLEKCIEHLDKKRIQLEELKLTLYQEIEETENKKELLFTEMVRLTDSINEANETRKKVVETAFLQYCALLECQYEDKEKEYNELNKMLEDSYEKLWDRLVQEKNRYADLVEEERQTLEKIRATRIAATEAQLREQEIKEQQKFYSLSVSAADLFDIEALEGIKSKLTKPRILSMLIWQTYFQKQMTSLCNNVLGANQVTGIYKITNQLNNKCYVGQAVDIADRWKEHAKCGLGIDTPASNKLYQAMIEDGIQNFTWELLEKCSSSELNEKEKYYIELYQSKDYGYNSLAGNSKK